MQKSQQLFRYFLRSRVCVNQVVNEKDCESQERKYYNFKVHIVTYKNRCRGFYDSKVYYDYKILCIL